MNIVGYFENKDSEKTIQEALNTLKYGEYHLETMDLAGICSKIDWNKYDAVAMDTKAWQYGKNVLKYFGVLPKINERPMLIFTLDTKKKKLKSWNSNRPFITVSPYASPVSILASIEELKKK